MNFLKKNLTKLAKKGKKSVTYVSLDKYSGFQPHIPCLCATNHQMINLVVNNTIPMANKYLKNGVSIVPKKLHAYLGTLKKHELVHGCISITY